MLTGTYFLFCSETYLILSLSIAVEAPEQREHFVEIHTMNGCKGLQPGLLETGREQ